MAAKCGSTWPGSAVRSTARSTWTQGQYAGAPPASQQRPQKVRMPRSRASDQSMIDAGVPPEPEPDTDAGTDTGTDAGTDAVTVTDDDTSPARPTRGLVHVVVQPWGNVWIDGKYVGRAPIKARLPKGRHVIEVGRELPSKRRIVRVQPGARKEVELVLTDE